MEANFPRGKVVSDGAKKSTALPVNDRLFGSSARKREGSTGPAAKRPRKGTSTERKNVSFDPADADEHVHKRADELNFKVSVK